MTPDPLVAALVARRKQLDITQQAVADRCGVAREYLSRVENGHSSPRVSLMIAYANAVDATLECVELTRWAPVELERAVAS